MKAGDILQIDELDDWYLWCKEKVAETDDPTSNPMILASGCWIAGLFNGPSAVRAFGNGEQIELLIRLKSGDKFTRVGHVLVDQTDIRYPRFYQHRPYRDEDRLFLCHGYQVVEQVDPFDQIADVRCHFTSLPGLIVQIRSEEPLEELRRRTSLDYRK